MIDIETLETEARANEPKVIYDMIKASCNCGTLDCKCDGNFYYPSTMKGCGAKAVLLEKTITVTYNDGTVATYTEPA
jgi:hypothetical protein